MQDKEKDKELQLSEIQGENENEAEVIYQKKMEIILGKLESEGINQTDNYTNDEVLFAIDTLVAKQKENYVPVEPENRKEAYLLNPQFDHTIAEQLFDTADEEQFKGSKAQRFGQVYLAAEQSLNDRLKAYWQKIIKLKNKITYLKEQLNAATRKEGDVLNGTKDITGSGNVWVNIRKIELIERWFFWDKIENVLVKVQVEDTLESLNKVKVGKNVLEGERYMLKFSVSSQNSSVFITFHKISLLGSVQVPLVDISNQIRTTLNLSILNESKSKIGTIQLELHYIYSEAILFRDILNEAEEMRSDHNFQLNNIQNSLEELHKPFPEIKGLHKLKVSDPDAENSSLQENNLPPFGQVLMVEKAYGDGEVGARITYLLLTCLLLVVFSIISSVSKSELCDITIAMVIITSSTYNFLVIKWILGMIGALTASLLFDFVWIGCHIFSLGVNFWTQWSRVLDNEDILYYIEMFGLFFVSVIKILLMIQLYLLSKATIQF